MQNNSDYTIEDVSDLFRDLEKSEMSEYMFEPPEKNKQKSFEIGKKNITGHRSQTELEDHSVAKTRGNEVIKKLRSFHIKSPQEDDNRSKTSRKDLQEKTLETTFNKSLSLNESKKHESPLIPIKKFNKNIQKVMLNSVKIAM